MVIKHVDVLGLDMKKTKKNIYLIWSWQKVRFSDMPSRVCLLIRNDLV